MANYCSFILRAEGKTENIEKLYKWLKAYYSYDNDTGEEVCSEEYHFYRIFECNCSEPFDEKEDFDYREFYGCCAWSVECCMIKSDEKTSYYSGRKHEIDLLEASKKLNLTIKVSADEPGCCFAEHYVIKDGKLLINDIKTIDIEESNSEEDYFDLYDKKIDEIYNEFYKIDLNY